jgi:hypothetical protein
VVARPLNFTVRGTVRGNSEAGACTSLDLEDPSLPRRVGKAIRVLDLTQCRCLAGYAVVARRYGSGRISLGSFGERPSLGAGAARRRAVGQCQVTWVASFGGDGSPSNHCLERTVMRLWWCAASAGRKYALASHWTRFWAAAQAPR